MNEAAPTRTPLVFLLLLAAACGPEPAPGPALILTGGRIYPTADPAMRFQALAIDGDQVVAVGTDAEIRAMAGNLTQEMNLEEAAVLPGFHDAWVDIEALGRWRQGLDLSRSGTPREVQAKLREAAASDTSEWIEGWGWDESIWPRQELPSHASLDAAVAERPVALWHRTESIGWLNATAMLRSRLQGTGIEGLVVGADGAWTGLVTGAALQAVRRLVPSPRPAVRQQRLADGLRAVAAEGITSLSTAPIDSGAIDALRRLRANDEIGPRIEIRLAMAGTALSAPADGPDPMRIGAIGLELDGSFGPRLASLSSPYADASTSGPRVDRASVQLACETATNLGLRLDVHVHGDAAFEAALDCSLLSTGQGLIIGGDLGSTSLGDRTTKVAAVPNRLRHDLYFLEARLGSRRAASVHAFRSLISDGRLAGFASLAPRYALSPMAAAWVSWRRQDLEGYPLDGWFGPQRIPVADALRYAMAGSWRGQSPTIEPGEPADLVVWSVDPYDDSERTLLMARAMVTIVGGRVVYSRPLVEPSFGGQP